MASQNLKLPQNNADDVIKYLFFYDFHELGRICNLEVYQSTKAWEYFIADLFSDTNTLRIQYD